MPQRNVMPMVKVKGKALTNRMEFGVIEEESLPPTGAEPEYLVLTGPYASRQIDRPVHEHDICPQTEFRPPSFAPFRGKMRLDPIEVIVDEDSRPFKIQFLCHSLQGDAT